MLRVFVIVLTSATVVVSHLVRCQILGVPSVTDGDTFRTGSQRIRLHGIEAPASMQRAGRSGGSCDENRSVGGAKAGKDAVRTVPHTIRFEAAES